MKPVPDDRVDAVIAVLSPSLATLTKLQEATPVVSGQEKGQMEELAQAATKESPVAAMIQLQRLAGMRSGEVTAIRTCDINTTGRLWVYQPRRHKTRHHGHSRDIYFGPGPR